jgi:hypothetical protein
MAVSHVKNNIIADFTGTVTVFNSAGSTQTVEASQLVRPSDWNSAHNQYLTLSGNTAGASTMSGSNIIMQGGNNVTLSADGASLIISAGAGGGGMGISAGTQSVSTGTMIFADSNGLTFGMSGSSQITGSYSQSTHSHATAAFSGSNGSFTANTVTFGNLNGLSFYTSNGSLVGSHNGLTSQTVQTQSNVQGISAGTQVGRTGDIVFSDSNGISFGMSGSTRITASYTVPSTAGLLSAINISAGTTSNNLSALTFSNGSGVTFGLNGSVLTASVAAAGGAQTGISGLANSETTYTSGSVTFSALGAITIRSTTGQQFQFSVNSQSVVPGIQTIAFANTTFTTGAVSFSNANGISFGSSGAQVTASHNALTSQSNQAFSADASSTFQTLTFQNSNGVSFSNNAGALRITHALAGTATAITGGASMTINSGGVSFNGTALAGTGTTFNGANISASMTQNTAGLQLSMSVAAPGAAAENNWFNLLGANTAGNTTASGSTIGLSGVGVTLSGTNGSVIVVSGGGGGAATIGGGELFQLNNATTFTTLGLNSVYFQRFINAANISFNYLEFRASGSTVSSTNSQRGAHTYDYGLYSRQTGASSTQYALISSSQFIMDVSISSNVSAAYTISQGAASHTSSSAGTALLSGLSGFKHLYFPFTSTITAGGEYALALRMSSATSVGTNAFRIALQQMSMINNLTVGKIGTAGVSATNASYVGDFNQGVYSVTSGALLGTVALSGLTNAISQMRMYVQFEV